MEKKQPELVLHDCIPVEEGSNFYGEDDFNGLKEGRVYAGTLTNFQCPICKEHLHHVVLYVRNTIIGVCRCNVKFMLTRVFSKQRDVLWDYNSSTWFRRGELSIPIHLCDRDTGGVKLPKN